MKRILLCLSLLLSASFGYGIDVWKSSNTATADTTKSLCNPQGTSTTNKGRGVVHSVCVNTGAAGTFTLYNSSATAALPMAAIDTTAKGCMDYDVALTSGVTYTNSATANVSLMYACY